MNAKPILFSTPMVQAIMRGHKNQTRRVIKPAPDHNGVYETAMAPGMGALNNKWAIKKDGRFERIKCPYGVRGDLLWVRETFNNTCGDTLYRADGIELGCAKWKPSIFMPKDLSRLTLLIRDIRVERLNDISTMDARYEGAPAVSYVGQTGVAHPIVCFRSLWESINGKDSWSDNPWVWVVEFDVIRMNFLKYMEEQRGRA